MEIGTALSVAQTLFAALQCSELKKICSFFGKESELVEFKSTVDTVKAVLLDAQNKEVVTNKHEAELYIQRLKAAVYDADDLLDEFVTLAEQNEHMKDQKVSKKVSLFFSSRNPFVVARNMSRDVKKIRKTLDAIASDHGNFGFGFRVDSQPIRKRRKETCSYVYESNIVGRKDDVEKIIGFLLDSSVKEDVSFLTIVGIGGLGKTALAQILFNDARVTSAFSLKLWVCVSDDEQEELDVEGILRKILASTIDGENKESTMDLVQNKLRENLASNKYLLVLDDVWTKKRKQWKDLVDFLLRGQKGSWIVVTTRSHETAKVVVGGRMHELQGLSRKDSELLFERIAFGADRASPHEDLIEIGREIVKQCGGVPLAIRVAGSMLYGQDKTKWLSLQKIGLSKSRDTQKDIMPILKLSYDQLESPLKSCFAYCALFPKDFEIIKELLISLWMAQGFIVPLDEGQTMNDAAEEYFSILLRRCFFQNVDHDEFGEIYSCKMHDLMHDVAQQVAGKEICLTDRVINVDEKVRHVALMSCESSSPHSFTKTHIRSYLFIGKQYGVMQQRYAKALVTNWVYLRALDLSDMDLECLPKSIGGLVHLRFLDLTWNICLEVLPKSITKLYNLETLKLARCKKLKELPNKLSKLVKLRILDLEGCDTLTNMPRGMGKLSCLHTLNRFMVKSTSWEQMFGGLEELKSVTSLKGKLKILIKFPHNDPKTKQGYNMEGGYLRNLKHLSYIKIKFEESEEEMGEEALRLVEELQPHANVKWFEFKGFNFEKGSCARRSNLKLPPHSILIRLELSELSVEHVTCLGNLPHLKTLKLIDLSELEYIIDGSATSAGTSCEPIASTSGELTGSNDEGFSLFPSLVKLEMVNLRKMEGWRRLRKGVGDNHQLLIDSTSSLLLLPQLKALTIQYCPDLESNLQCPVLEELFVLEFNKRLQIIQALIKELRDKQAEATTYSSINIPTLRKIKIADLKWLNSLPTLAFQRLTSLTIYGDREVESLEEVVFRSMTSLRSLFITSCSNLRCVVSGGLEHLTSLEELDIYNCANMRLSEEKRQDGIDIDMPCPSLSHTLRTLKLAWLPQLVELPYWMQFLTTLQSLVIRNCKGLESLPNWMPKLTSLHKLQLVGCSQRLKERCQDSTGEDWPLIENIPYIDNFW